MVSSSLTAAQSSSESGMTKTTAGMSTTSSDHDANPQHHQDHQDDDDEEDYGREGEEKDSYTVTTSPGRYGGSKTVWSEPASPSRTTSSTGTGTASPRDADAADVSAHSLSSGRSLSSARSSRSRNGAGGSKSGGRAASMLARTRLTATTSAASMRSISTSQQAKSAPQPASNGNGSGITATASSSRARSFDDDIVEDEHMQHVLPSSSAEYIAEYSTSLNDDIGQQRQQQPQQQQQVDSSRFYVSPPPEMSQQQQQIPQQQQQQQRPQINQLAVLFSQAQSLGQRAFDRGQQSYRNIQNLRQGHGYDDANGGRRRDDEEEGPATQHPEIAGGHHGQSHESFFSGATAENAASYMSDMCSLLIVLIQAPFLWLYFVITGRDYHDRYGNVNLQQTSEGIYGGVDATTSQSTFGSRTSKMSAEEKQERSEVYLEAKDEDGELFAMLCFHHPGLSPLVDETVDNVALAQVLGEDTGKTGHTDLAAALNPDGMVLDDSDDDDSSGTGDFDARSVGSAGLSEVFGGGIDASRSGRSRTSRSSRSRHRSKSRARSTSVDARVRRNRDDDEWEYDITTQKMKRKKKTKRGRRGDRSNSASRRGSVGSAASHDARSFGGALGLEDELVSTRSGDLTTASAHSEPPKVIGGASTSGSSWGGGRRRGRRRSSVHSSDQESRRRSRSADGQRAIAKFKAAIEQKGGIKSVADEWEARGKTSDMDRAAWKSSSDMDDIMAIATNELADIGDVPSPYVQPARPAPQRPDGRKGLGMNSFRKVQDTLRKSTRSMSSHDGAQQVNHDEDVVRPITDIV